MFHNVRISIFPGIVDLSYPAVPTPLLSLLTSRSVEYPCVPDALDTRIDE